MAPTDAVEGDDHGNVLDDSATTAYNTAFEVLSDGRKCKASEKIRNELKVHVELIYLEYLKVINENKRLKDLVETVAQPFAGPSQAQSPESKLSYSVVAAKGTITKPAFDIACTLRVYPKESPGAPSRVASSEATKELLKGLKLTDLKVGVKAIKSIGSKGVSVLCRDQGEVAILKDAIDKHNDL